MADGFQLSFEFVEKWGRFAKPEYLKIYIYILSKYKKDKTVYSISELSEVMDIKTAKIRAALEYWALEGLIALSENGYIFTETTPKKAENQLKAVVSSRPSYTHTEIDSAATKNQDISYLFKQAEKILGKLLSTNDMEVLYSFVDWLNLPVEVIIMIITYAAGKNKNNMRYIEKVAIDWADREINTYEKAEAYIIELEEAYSKERKIRTILGINDRALSVTEKKYINIWAYEKDIPLDLIPIAYDKTMMKTGGKMGWAYMNKLLCSWFDEGIKTQEELEIAQEHFKIKQNEEKTKTPQKGANKFSNYQDTNKIDYDKYAEQILADMLDE
ncbi:MAG: DnaD domain protein [Ruminococcaceae bacterium]|nr:DnaD domain protein [Oscillospiraceae bacterium]